MTALYSGVDLRVRVSLFSLVMAAFATLSAREIMRGGKQEALLSRLPMALILAAMAVGLLARAGVAWLHPPWRATDTFYEAWVTSYRSRTRSASSASTSAS